MKKLFSYSYYLIIKKKIWKKSYQWFIFYINYIYILFSYQKIQIVWVKIANIIIYYFYILHHDLNNDYIIGTIFQK